MGISAVCVTKNDNSFLIIVIILSNAKIRNLNVADVYKNSRHLIR
nr:MAG TPA: hypothetical protein [Caudoviricetes sp.]